MRETTGAHEDLSFRILGQERVSDSYYLVIDPEFERRWADVQGVEFVRRCVHALFAQWKVVVEGLKDSDPRFLPFDFSDQSTSYLRVILGDSEALCLNVGWSTTEGHEFRPSDISAVVRGVRDFRPELLEDVVAPRASLLEALDRVLCERLS